jgi:hypothetical protein
MNTDDAVKILEAVGDSWPAAIVFVAGVAGVIAWKAIPRLREIADVLKDVRHEMNPNSGKSMRDAVDRIEKTGAETKAALDAHIVEDNVWKTQAEDLLTGHDGEP